ncbi:MAG: alpha/beta hydrolase, partial [Pseudomonadota bacterium]
MRRRFDGNHPATADDGTKIAYAVTGTGPPLIRAPHFPTHLELEWSDPFGRPLIDELSQYRTLIRFDQRGGGLSDLDVDDFSAHRYARDLLAVADTLGLDRFALFGSSSGGMIAVEAAAHAPERVTQVIT